jgi:hypothetical protein
VVVVCGTAQQAYGVVEPHTAAWDKDSSAASRMNSDDDDRAIVTCWACSCVWAFVTLVPHWLGTTSTHVGETYPLSTLGGVVIYTMGLILEIVADYPRSACRHDDAVLCQGWLGSSVVLHHSKYVGEVLVWLGIAVLHAPALVEPRLSSSSSGGTRSSSSILDTLYRSRRAVVAFLSPLLLALFWSAQATGYLTYAKDIGALTKYGYSVNNAEYTKWIETTPLLRPGDHLFVAPRQLKNPALMEVLRSAPATASAETKVEMAAQGQPVVDEGNMVSEDMPRDETSRDSKQLHISADEMTANVDDPLSVSGEPIFSPTEFIAPEPIAIPVNKVGDKDRAIQSPSLHEPDAMDIPGLSVLSDDALQWKML